MNKNQNNLHNYLQFHNKLTIKILNDSIENDIIQKEEYIDYYVVQSKILTFMSNMPLSYRAILEKLIMKDMSLKISKFNFFADVNSTYTPGFISGFKNNDSKNPQYSFLDVDLNFKLINMQREDVDIISASFDFLDPESAEKTKGANTERANEFDFDFSSTRLLNFEDVIEKLDDFANPIAAHHYEDYDEDHDEDDDDDDEDFDEDDIFIGPDY
jgi:hypothetical protein